MSPPVTASTGPLRLTPELAEKIRSLTIEGLNALPRRGAEFGGLITFAPSSTSLAADLLPIRFEHRFGLSKEDVPRFAEAAAECGKEGKVIAAYFRSSARSNGVVDPEDRRAIASACPEASFAVIARPAIGASAHVRIFRSEPEDQWTVLRELILSPPDRAVPSIGAGAVPPQDGLRALDGAAPPASSRIAEAFAPELGVDEFVDRRQPSALPLFLKGRLTTVLLSAAVLILAGVVVVKMPAGSQPQSRHSASDFSAFPQSAPLGASEENRLGLAVRQEGAQLHLSWSRDSLAARTAASGMLQILDGATPVAIRLAPSDLREGSLIYTPRSQDVTFQLRLGTSAPNAEEMIRVIGSAPPVRTGAPVETAGAPTPPARPETEERRPVRHALSSSLPPASHVAVHDKAPQRVATRAANPKPPEAPSAQPQSAQTRPAQTQTTQTQPTQTQTTQTQPAQTQPAQTQPAQTQPAQTQIARAIPPPDAAAQTSSPISRQPAATQPAQPATPLRQESPPAATASVPGTSPPVASAGASVAPNSSGVGYPTPLRQVQPSLAGTRWRVPETTRVAVVVNVDARGFVTDAKPEASANGTSMFLEGLCLNAARQWTFKPATVHGKPVAGKYQIEFVFRPQ